MQAGQQVGQLLARSDVQAIKRLVENQQVGVAHQRLAEERFAGFARRQIFKAPRQQVANTKLRRQPGTAFRVASFIFDDFRGGATGIFFAGAEHIGIVTLPLVADQFLQLFKGEASDTLKCAFALPV